MTDFSRLVSEKIDRYIGLRQAVGYQYETQASTLRAFGRFVKKTHDRGPLTQKLALAFVASFDVTPNVRNRRYAMVRNFAEYLSIFEPRTEDLDPRALPRSRAIPPARILDDDELQDLLLAARTLSPEYPMRGQTLYTAIGLLASTGLRSGEVVRLDRGDVDLDRAVLTIRQTKFRKDRLVPVHPTTRDVLRVYVKARDAAYRRAPSPAFFLSCRGARLSADGLGTAFQEACARAGLDRGLPRGVRPGDLRHRFAVKRLVTWRREGVDVQARLPVLATYMGHARYSDTAYYVTGTAELLGLAAARAFERKRGAR
jgi:integrase